MEACGPPGHFLSLFLLLIHNDFNKEIHEHGCNDAANRCLTVGFLVLHSDVVFAQMTKDDWPYGTLMSLNEHLSKDLPSFLH